MFKKLFLSMLLIFSAAGTCLANNQNDILINAAVNGTTRLVEKALANGANVNYTPPYRLSALTIAVKNKKYEMVKVLLEHKADPNLAVNNGFSSDTPLLYAIYNNDAKITELLLQYGANPNQGRIIHGQIRVDVPQKTPGKPHPGKNKYDVTYEIYITPEMRGRGATPLIYAIQKDGNDSPSVEIVRLLLANGADPNKTNDYGYTPLMAAADLQFISRKFMRLDIARLLLDNGADVQREDNYGNTALNFASATKFKEMADILLPLVN